MDVSPLSDRDDPESVDALDVVGGDPGRLDLTPRDVAARPARRGRRWPALVVLAVVIAGIGFVLVNGLSNATTFFYNVDQAVAKRPEIGDRAIRLQGNVVPDSQRTVADGVEFALTYHGVSVEVDHHGEVPDLFQPAIPVIIEGRFRGNRFESDKILVRHDNTYDEKNSERIDQACRDAAQVAGSGSTPATPSPECSKALGQSSSPPSTSDAP